MGLATTAWVLGRYGSWDAFLGRLRGQVLLPHPPLHKLGVLEPGSEKKIDFSIQNITDTKVTVVGLNTSCMCAVATHLPLVIKPGEERVISFRIRTFLESEPGPKSTIIHLHLDRPAPETVLAVEWEQTSGAVAVDLPHPMPMPQPEAESKQTSESWPLEEGDKTKVFSVSNETGVSW